MQAAQPEPLAAEPGSWLALGTSKTHLGLTAWGRALLPALCPQTPRQRGNEHQGAEPGRAGSSHRIRGRQQPIKILLSLLLLQQGNSTSPLFLPPSR